MKWIIFGIWFLISSVGAVSAKRKFKDWDAFRVAIVVEIGWLSTALWGILFSLVWAADK